MCYVDCCVLLSNANLVNVCCCLKLRGVSVCVRVLFPYMLPALVCLAFNICAIQLHCEVAQYLEGIASLAVINTYCKRLCLCEAINCAV